MNHQHLWSGDLLGSTWSRPWCLPARSWGPSWGPWPGRPRLPDAQGFSVTSKGPEKLKASRFTSGNFIGNHNFFASHLGGSFDSASSREKNQYLTARNEKQFIYIYIYTIIYIHTHVCVFHTIEDNIIYNNHVPVSFWGVYISQLPSGKWPVTSLINMSITWLKSCVNPPFYVIIGHHHPRI